MPAVLISSESAAGDGEHVDRLRAAGFEVRRPPDDYVPGERDDTGLIELLGDAEAMIAGGDWLTRPVLEACAPRLRVVARTGVGYDRVDCEAAADHGVVVTITPNANHECVAEHTIALLLAAARNVASMDRGTREGKWPRQVSDALRGKTLGLLGMGRIGRSVVPRAQAFRLKVIAHDPFADEAFASEHGVELVDFEDLLSRSEVLSVHCPLMPSTRGLVDASAIAKLPQGSIVVNAARGGIIDEDALVDALRSGQVRAAGLDVFDIEPVPADHPLLELDNVVLSPHSGGLETLAARDMSIDAAQCVIDLQRGSWPEESVVNPAVGDDGWNW